MWTKRQVVVSALAELGITNPEPDDEAEALVRLDAMVAGWQRQSIQLGYNLPPSPDASALEHDTGLADADAETVLLNLACRLAPMHGKAISPETSKAARRGYDSLLLAAAEPVAQVMPDNLPIGAGNRMYRGGRSYYPVTSPDPMPTGSGGDLALNAE